MKDNKPDPKFEAIKVAASLTDSPFKVAFKASLGVMAAQALGGLLFLGGLFTLLVIIGLLNK